MVKLEVRQTTALYMFEVLVCDGRRKRKLRTSESMKRNKPVGFWI